MPFPAQKTLTRDWGSTLNVYKYRRRSTRVNALLQRPALGTSSGSHSFYDDEPKTPKTYTVLQESRSSFTHNKLRSFFIICSSTEWKLFTAVTLFFAYIIDTSLYGFVPSRKRSIWPILSLICLNLVFTFDVAIIVVLKISEKWRKTLNLVEMDTKRVIFDVFLAVPYSLLYLFNLSNDPARDHLVFDFHAIVPVIALMRIYRIVEHFYKKSSQAGSNQWSTFLAQYLILFVLSVHSWTCTWYLFSYRKYDLQKLRMSWSISAVNLPTETIFDWYFVCAYWSVTFLTTNALGDLYPVTTTERVLATIAIFVGFTLTTVVFVGSLTSQFITITTRRSKYVRQLNKIMNHLSLIEMDAHTTKRIIRYYEDLWYQKSGVFNPNLLQMLPSPLKMEICYDLNAIPLYSSLIFRKLPEAFLRRLSLAMAHRFYLPGDIIYEHNLNKTMMVCITNGVVELLSDEDDETPMISFKKGTCFGESSLVYNIPARCTVKAATYVECQVLQKTEFIRLMITYPDLLDQMRKEIRDRIEKSHRRQLGKNYSALNLNIYVSKDKTKSRMKCLKEKLRYIQGKTDVDTVTEKDKLDQSCLDLYIISNNVRKKTKLFTCINQGFPWILEADCLLVKYWELYMLLLVFYVCIAYPLNIAFNWSKPSGMFVFSQIALNISLVFNMMITTTTAVKTKKKYIKKFWSIVNYRMNTIGFYLDMIAIVPLEHIVTIHTTTMYPDIFREHLFYVAKGTKLCLVWRLSHFFQKLETKLLYNSLVVKVAKYCIYITLLCYWCGLVLFMEACFDTRCSEDSWIVKIFVKEARQTVLPMSRIEYPLLTSVYFATTLLLSVGYGDFVPGDQYDMGCVAFLSLFGVLFSGYTISEISAVVTHYSKTKTAFLEVVITMDKFMKENSMHRAIRNRIMAFYELQWQYNSGVDLTDDSWLEKNIVPAELRKKVLHQARFKALTSIRFFQVKNKAYIHKLTEASKDIILPPGVIIYYGGTVTRDLYIIESGYCLITSEKMREKKNERVIGPGNHLGLLVLLYGVPAVSTVVTLTHCKLISISYAAYTSALSLFPDMREHEGLLTQDELKQIEDQAKTLHQGACMKYYNRLALPTLKITNILQDFVNESFINVLEDYRKRKQSYWKSYKQFSFMSGIVPYLLMPIAIKPDGIFLKTWNLCRISVAFFTSLLIPVTVAMAPTATFFNEVVILLEAFCYLDLYLKLHIAYYGPKKQLIYHPYLTAKYYLTRAFLLDLITCFPWYAIHKLYTPKHNEGHSEGTSYHFYHCIIRMTSVFQIYKLHIAFLTDSISALKRVYLMSVVQFLLLTIFYLNLYACILITLTCRYVQASSPIDMRNKIQEISLGGPYIKTDYHPDGSMICQRGSWIDNSKIIKEQHLWPLKVYLLAAYWTATSFSGAGFGDITPQNTSHIILTIVVMVHGVVFFGYVYARIASLKAMADQVATTFLENLKQLELFMYKEKVNFTLKRAIMEYWKYQWKRTGGWSHQKILNKLHANLKEDALLFMYEKTLREIPLFENVENTFFRAFAKQLRELYFQKGYMVTRANEVMHNIYIIYRGKVDVMSDAHEIEACMGPGGIFGNIRGETKFLTVSNITASRNIDLLCIDGAEFYALLKSYPTVYRKVMYSVSSTLKDYVLPALLVGRMSIAIDTIPLTYEAGENSDSDDMDGITGLESPSGRSIAESQGSRSITIAHNSQYAPALWLLILPHKWFCSSVVPDSKWVIFMEYFILLLSYAEFMFLAYEMAFLSNPYIVYISIVIDIIFLYKVFLDMHTSYMNRYGDYILNPRKVRKAYFSKVYLRRRDFLTNLPVCYLALALSLPRTTELALFCYLRTPQLFRISHLFTYQTHRQNSIGSANLFVKLTTIIVFASIMTHLGACLFFKLSCLTPVHCTTSNWMTKLDLQLKSKYSQGKYFSLYIASLWYMMNLITIAGMGDVSSQNNFEVIETIVLIIIIKFCTGLLISEMSALIGAHVVSLTSYDYSINELRDGLKYMDLSEHQINKMWDYVKKLWTRQQGRQMPQLIHELPFRFRSQIMQTVYGIHISNSVIFSKTEEDFKRMLCMWLSHCVFFPGNYIVQCGDSDQCLYFIHRGEVEVLTVHANMTESIYDVLEPEDCFGIAQGLYVGITHHFSFRARTVVDIVYLKLEQWKYLLDFYPKSARIVQHKVENIYLSI